MERNDRIVVMGEDVRIWGGVFGRFKGFKDRFGENRVMDTPISEAGFVGVAVGAAATGLRPVVDLMFVDFFGVTADQLFNQAAKDEIHVRRQGKNSSNCNHDDRRGIVSRGAAFAVSLLDIRPHPGNKVRSSLDTLRRQRPAYASVETGRSCNVLRAQVPP